MFAQFTPLALSAIKFGYFYIFFAFCLVSIVAFIMFYPETKGKTLEQVSNPRPDIKQEHKADVSISLTNSSAISSSHTHWRIPRPLPRPRRGWRLLPSSLIISRTRRRGDKTECEGLKQWWKGEWQLAYTIYQRQLIQHRT